VGRVKNAFVGARLSPWWRDRRFAMPTAQELLDGLTATASEAMPLAVAWHLVVLGALAAVAMGWRPSARLVGVLLAAPIASAAMVASVYGNLFNALMLGATAVVVALLGARLPEGAARPGRAWAVVAGGAMIAFGWVYPHFLSERTPLILLAAAPVGLLPCPTLALVIGFALPESLTMSSRRALAAPAARSDADCDIMMTPASTGSPALPEA
jgi:hypothetical protein